MTSPETKPAPRVLLFWPVFHSVLPEAFQNFMRLVVTAVQRCPQYRFDPWIVSRSAVHGAMNDAVNVALENGHEYLIAFDDDCLPELPEFALGDNRRWQVIPRMLAIAEMGYPILAGVGYMRGYPHTTTVGRLYPHGTSLVLNQDPDKESQFKGFYWLDDLTKHETEVDANGLLKVDFCGVPIVCIHKSVLNTIPRPLFETNDSVGGQTTHDVFFCHKAREHGFSIHVDTHIDCGHLVAQPLINRDTKKAFQRVLAPHAQGSLPCLTPPLSPAFPTEKPMSLPSTPAIAPPQP